MERGSKGRREEAPGGNGERFVGGRGQGVLGRRVLDFQTGACLWGSQRWLCGQGDGPGRGGSAMLWARGCVAAGRATQTWPLAFPDLPSKSRDRHESSNRRHPWVCANNLAAIEIPGPPRGMWERVLLQDGLAGGGCVCEGRVSRQSKRPEQSLRGGKEWRELKGELRSQSGWCSESWGEGGGTRCQTFGGFPGEQLADSDEF